MSASKLENIFGDIQELYDYHSLFLYQIQDKLNNFGYKQTIGDIFINFVAL